MNAVSELSAAPRRTRERERKVEDLLNAASLVFAKKGFHGTSMEEIARAAEYATGAVYRYFPGKEALFAELVERKINRLLEFLQECTREAADSEEALRSVIACQIEFARHDLTLLRIFYEERLEASLSKEGWSRIEVQHFRLIDWLAAGVRDGQEKGVFQEGDPRLYAIILQGMLHGLYRDWISIKRTTQSVQDEIEFITNLCLRAILKTPKP